jgi:hypothetical protein
MGMLELVRYILMVIGVCTLMGGFCLVMFLPIGIGLYIVSLKQKRARDIVAHIEHTSSTMRRQAQQDMETLTAQFRTHINEQTKQYRTSQAGGQGEDKRTQGSRP